MFSPVGVYLNISFAKNSVFPRKGLLFFSFLGELRVVSKYVKSSRKDGIAQNALFKTKVLYRVLEKATPSSYWLQRLDFCEDLGKPRRKVK